MDKQQLRQSLIERMKTLAENGLKTREQKKEFIFMGKMYKKHVINYNNETKAKKLSSLAS